MLEAVGYALDYISDDDHLFYQWDDKAVIIIPILRPFIDLGFFDGGMATAKFQQEVFKDGSEGFFVFVLNFKEDAQITLNVTDFRVSSGFCTSFYDIYEQKHSSTITVPAGVMVTKIIVATYSDIYPVVKFNGHEFACENSLIFDIILRCYAEWVY
jgi:hypothetical protein